MITHYILGFGAGVLSLLAPCVLPILPIIFGSSIQSSKIGPMANALGLTLSFTLVGILTSIFSSLFDINTIQKIGAIILISVGILFVLPDLKNKLTTNLNFLSDRGHHLQNQIQNRSFYSEFLMGATLGLIWSPCSGPTLAFAFGIASQADHFLHASLIFFFFGLGAGIGLISLGYALGKIKKLKLFLLNHLEQFNKVLGFISITIGSLILIDKLSTLEEFILNILPSWFVQIPTSL